MLGLGELVDQAAGEHVDELDVGVADDEAARGADSDGDLHRELDTSRRAGVTDRPDRAPSPPASRRRLRSPAARRRHRASR